MSDEYAPTFVDSDGSSEDPRHLSERSDNEKRAYAFGADRKGQLRTTDLFPKRLWAILLCGVMLLGIVAGLNVLNAWAPAWRPFIGDASARAISLSGPGSLTSWMLAMLLMLTGLASLQIFALRQHRCDDYTGTYRIWLIVPPIFFVASIAAIVDFEAIVLHFASLAQIAELTNESLVPMTVKLSVLAIFMMRMLFEVRDSRSAFSMLVVAWLAIAISTVLNTSWAENRIASQDLALVYFNTVLFATIALFLTHLFYVRFVYLHAHGLIAPKQIRETSKSKSKPSVVAKSNDVDANEETVVKKSKSKQRAAEKSKSVSSGKSQTTKTVETAKPVETKAKPVKSTASSVSKRSDEGKTSAQTPAAKKKTNSMSDFQALLKKKQAEEAAKKAASGSTASVPLTTPVADSDDEVSTIKMSKSERRRLRKQAKAKRKAA